MLAAILHIFENAAYPLSFAVNLSTRGKIRVAAYIYLNQCIADEIHTAVLRVTFGKIMEKYSKDEKAA